MRQRLRIWLWRYRYVLAAGLLTVAALSGVQKFRPPPAGELVAVAAGDLPAGEPIAAQDVTQGPFAGSTHHIAVDPVGQTPVVTIPTGMPIAESMLLGPGLADHAPPGTVLAPVHVSDPHVLTLLRVGDRVDLYTLDLGSGSAEATLVSAGVQVLALTPESAGGFLNLNDTEPATFLGAIAATDANVFTGASGLAPFSVVISPAQN